MHLACAIACAHTHTHIHTRKTSSEWLDLTYYSWGATFLACFLADFASSTSPLALILCHLLLCTALAWQLYRALEQVAVCGCRQLFDGVCVSGLHVHVTTAALRERLATELTRERLLTCTTTQQHNINGLNRTWIIIIFRLKNTIHNHTELH